MYVIFETSNTCTSSQTVSQLKEVKFQRGHVLCNVAERPDAKVCIYEAHWANTFEPAHLSNEVPHLFFERLDLLTEIMHYSSYYLECFFYGWFWYKHPPL